jgi:AcrR family transcriptional regulator
MADVVQRRVPKFRRRAEARPDEVLDAALELFVARGFATTRVEDIAVRAGLSKGAVYLYFPSKEAILEGLVKRALVPIADNALSFLSNYVGDPRVVVTAVLKMIATRLADPRLASIPRLMMREIVHHPVFAETYRREVLDRVIPAVTQLIRNGIDEGYLRPVDPELTLRSIIGPVIFHLLIAEIFHIQPADGLAVDRLIDNHLTILFDGLSAPRSERRFLAT